MELYTFNNLQLGGVQDNYKLIPLKIVKIFESLANYYDISRKSRGLEKPTKSDKGFLQLYKKLNGKWEKMKSLPVKKSNPNGEKWAASPDYKNIIKNYKTIAKKIQEKIKN